MRCALLIAVATLPVALACGGSSAPDPAPAGTVTFTVDGPGPTDTPTAPTPAPRPTAVAAADPRSVFGGVPVGNWAFGEAGVLPPGLAIYYYVGGYGTEGAPGPGQRALGLADGSVDLAQLRPPLAEDERPPDYAVFSMAADERFGTLFAGVCVKSWCGYLDYAAPDAEAVVYRSLDGGFTWGPYGDLERDWWVAGVLDQDTAILRYHGPDEVAVRYRLHPGGQPYEPPGTGYPQFIEGWGNAYLIDTDIQGNRYVDYYLSDANNRWHYIAKVAPGGDVLRAWEWEVSEFARPVSVVAPDLLTGSVLVDERIGAEDGRFNHVEAALLDMKTGFAQVLPDLSEGLTGNRHPWVTQSVAGEFLAVDTPGSCLNVRTAPTVSGEIIRCYPDGVLFLSRHDSVFAEGSEWLAVTAPDGASGWAVARFLLR